MSAESVLLTGAGGQVGRVILSRLTEAYDWRLLYFTQPAEVPPDPYVVGDIRNRATVREAVDGCDAVVHLAGDPRRDAPWTSVLENNIDGTHTIYDVAAATGVDRVVYASSNHAVGAYEDSRAPALYRADSEFRLDGTERFRPSNKYGISKATGELIGRHYHDTRGVTVCNIRIGNLNAGHPPVDYERGQAMWLSPRDCAHLHDRALQADYEYETVYGISDNDRKYYSLERARSQLGYEPKDNSAEWDGKERIV